MQTLEAMEEPSCSGNGETVNNPDCQYSRSVTVFETPCVSESYLDSEESAYGNVLVSTFYHLRAFSCLNLKAKSRNLCTFYSVTNAFIYKSVMPSNIFPVFRQHSLFIHAR